MHFPSRFRYFKTNPEIIRLAAMLYIRFPLSLRNVEDLLHERGIEISQETVRYWWNRFGPMFAEIRAQASPLHPNTPNLTAAPGRSLLLARLRSRWRCARKLLGTVAYSSIVNAGQCSSNDWTVL
jgi:hypothetical protein